MSECKGYSLWSAHEQSPLPLKIQAYKLEGFPDAVATGCPSEKYEVCRLCGDWCQLNSTCSDRYFVMVGNWKSGVPPFDQRIVPDSEYPFMATIPFCDKHHPIEDFITINVMGYPFKIDSTQRMND